MKNSHWQYFISLEKDFVESMRYVELDAANGSAFSIIYARMLLSASVEVESLLKALCERIAPGGDPRNIDQYRDTILRRHAAFHQIEIQIPSRLMMVKPWASWGAGTNPDWWHAYTSVKHDRTVSFGKAKQTNVVASLAGLFAALIYFYETEINAGNFGSEPQLFEYPSMFPDHIVTGHKLKLPV